MLCGTKIFHFDSDNELHAKFMMVARQQFQRMHESLGSEDIHHGQGMILGALRHYPNSNQKELSDLLRRRPSTIAIMLSRMERDGLVNRETDTTDQRIMRIKLTPRGFEVTEQVEDKIRLITKQCFASFTQDEKDALRNLLNKMSLNLECIVDNKKTGKE